jgi:flagellar basal-body rod protein FlgF
MQGSLYVALSSQIALERRMTTLADNVANANDHWFRATEIKFNEVLADTGVANVSFVDQGKDYLSTENGGFAQLAASLTLPFAARPGSWSRRPPETCSPVTDDLRLPRPVSWSISMVIRCLILVGRQFSSILRVIPRRLAVMAV